MKRKILSNWYELKNQGEVPEVLIYGYVGPFEEVDFVSFQATMKQLALVHTVVRFRIHSGGGSVIDGLPIYDCMLTCGMEREVVIDGMAASMASVFSQAASKGKRKMHKNGTMMIHRVKGAEYGNADDLRAYADLVEDREKRIKQIFVTSTGQEPAVVDGWFAKNTDWWINAEQALALGLIDEIIEQDNTDAPALPINKLQDMGEFKAYEALKNSITDKSQKLDMNKLQILVMAALAARGVSVLDNATEEQVAKHVTDALKVADDKVIDLQNKLNAKDGERADALVNSLVTAGKIKADDDEGKKEMKELALVNYAMAVKLGDKMEGTTTAPKNVIVNIGTTDTGLKAANDPENRENWTFDDYRKKDPKALENMRDNEAEKYNKLFNAAYK